MAFNGAHGFSINVQRDFNQVDMGSRGHEIMQTLMKAACPGASHESAERADPPRCHPDTRKEVITQIMNWVDSFDTEKRILWLSAAAGAGKSSIAQTIADKCAKDGNLLSSFFFSRTATGSGRDDGNRLIPTIAYHLAVAVPDARDLIVSEIERDPASFQHSMDVQLKRLVIDPIIRLVELENRHIPSIVIIDGLDECNGTLIQSKIISTIAKGVCETSSCLRFFFASRAERYIQKTFNFSSVKAGTLKLTLEEDEKAFRDIEVFVKSEFNNIKNNHILSNELLRHHYWPSRSDIWTLVNRSSGYFIYTSTVMKYISADDQDPREALSTIIHRSMTNLPDENPVAELDALYIHILSTAASRTKGGYNAFLSVLQVLTLTTGEGILTSSDSLAEFLGVTKSALTLGMMHLHSIIYFPAFPASLMSHLPHREPSLPPALEKSQPIKFHHASFKDFLLDPSRSEKFLVDIVEGHKFLGRRCLALLQGAGLVPSNATSKFKYSRPLMLRYSTSKAIPRDPTMYAVQYLFVHIEHSVFNIQLLNEFIRVINVKSLISDMLDSIGIQATHQLLGLICTIDFDISGAFAVPKAFQAAEVCYHISNAMDEMVLDHFTDTPALETYLQAICYGTGGYHDVFYSWATTIMDIPERAKHLYVSDEKAKCFIFTSLSAPVVYGYYVMGIYQKHWPPIIQFLFERIKPSQEFGNQIRRYLPNLRWTLNGEQIYQKSVYNILKKCGLEL